MESGMTSLLADGLRRVVEGQTTLREIQRVLAMR